MDQTWSNRMSHQSKNITIKICHIYKKNNNGCFILDFFWSDLPKFANLWSNLIKLDFSPIKKWKVNDCFILFFFGSDLSKMDETWSNFLARNGFLAVMAFLQKLLFVQKYLCQIWSGFLARKRFFFKWICLTSQSIEMFGSPLMAESFQDCFVTSVTNYQLPITNFSFIKSCNWMK